METTKSYDQLLAEKEELQWQLEEATDTIDAIRSGQVDALIVKNDNGSQIYTLKSADQTYRVFFEKMNEGAVSINKEGYILYSNSAFAAMVKLPLEKVIGLSFDIFIPDEQIDNYKKFFDAGWCKDSKEEMTIRNRNGKKTYCLISCNTLQMDDGIALSLIITDLTEQKEIQQQLTTRNKQLEEARHLLAQLNNNLEDAIKESTNDLLVSREHFKLLADHVTQLTWINLPNGEVNFFNDRWFEYTGLNFDESKEWGWRSAVHPDDIELTISRYIAALQSGEKFEVKNRYKRGIDGVYRWHLNRALPLKDEDGEILFWVNTATDIDDQIKEMERKDEFIGVASHELKTPLTSLKGYLQLIAMQAKNEVSPKVEQYVSKANLAIGKLQHLVDDLLDVSKIQAGQLDYSIDIVNLVQVVNICAENATHMYADYDITVESTRDEYLIKGNAERLEQVIMNLINNAVKYSKTNKKIIIRTTNHENWVRVSVTDLGIGLSKEQKHRIFERFYRVEDKKYMTSGLGMGLYISTQIINTHNGRIGVESEFGKGSTFYFDLPLEEVNA